MLDYELAEPRYAEDLNTLNRMIAGRVQAGRPELSEHAGAFQVAGQDRRHRAALPDAEGGCQASLAQRDGGASSRGDDARPALRTRRACLLAALRRAAVAERAERHRSCASCAQLGRRRRSGCVTLRRCLRSCWHRTSKRPRQATPRKGQRLRRHPRHPGVRQQGRRRHALT